MSMHRVGWSAFLSMVMFISQLQNSDGAILVTRCLTVGTAFKFYISCTNRQIEVISAQFGRTYEVLGDRDCFPYHPTPDDCYFTTANLTVDLRGQCNEVRERCRPSVTYPVDPEIDKCSAAGGTGYIQLQYLCHPIPSPGNDVTLLEGGARSFRQGDNEVIHLKTAHYTEMTMIRDAECTLTIDPRAKVEVDIRDLSYDGDDIHSSPYCIKWRPAGVETCANNTEIFTPFTLMRSTLLTITVTPNATFEGRFWMVLKVELDGAMWDTDEPTLEIQCEQMEQETTTQGVTTMAYEPIIMEINPLERGIHKYEPKDIIELKSQSYPETIEISRGAKCMLKFPSDVEVLLIIHHLSYKNDSPKSPYCLQWDANIMAVCANNTQTFFLPHKLESSTNIYLTLNNVSSFEGQFWITLQGIEHGSNTRITNPSLTMECEDVKQGTADQNFAPDDDEDVPGTNWNALIGLIVGIVVIVIIIILLLIFGSKIRDRIQKKKADDKKREKEKDERVGIHTLRKLNSVEEGDQRYAINYGATHDGTTTPTKDTTTPPPMEGDYDNLPPMKNGTAPAPQTEDPDYDDPMAYAGLGAPTESETHDLDQHISAPTSPNPVEPVEYVNLDAAPGGAHSYEPLHGADSKDPLIDE